MTETENKKKLIQTPIMFEEKMIKAIDCQARHEGLFRGRSILIRRAVAEYLERHAPQQEPAASEVAV